MNNSIWQKIDEIFPLVADLPAAERETRLSELCGTDAHLRREIESLLAVDEKAEGFIESPVILPNSLSLAFAGAASEKPQTLELNGEKIGAYRIVKKIGTGGMGAVYLAERADGEFKKQAAIKLIRNGADTDFNLTRFRRERQILAALEHPNIARLLDGGTTEKGLPYFVMEYVEGKTLFDYFQKREIDVREYLQLFRQICAAVSYAHSKGLIHRDIKPANILVTSAGVVKLLDFGIAKILDADFIEENVAQTATLMRQMTPEYASPEQIKGETMTAASDVYSLAVVLYELLCGTRPYKFPSRAAHEIARVVCEEKVRPPDFKFQISNPEDLNFILLKALQKKPAERYASVGEFDRDIERFLDGLPVLTHDARLKFFEEAVSNSGGAGVALAVAPFRILAPNSSSDGEPDNSDDFLSVGLADALTMKLSGIRQIVVRPTSSVMRLAAESTDALALGRQIDADYVLEGSILRSAEQIRVNVQLLKTRDDSVLWSEQFDESEGDVFRFQDSISERVAASLVPRLTTEEQEILHRHGTKSAAAYEAYLRGRVAYHVYTFAGITASENYFKQAIEHDPDFAPAHSGLADFYNWKAIAGLISNREGFARAKEAAQKAIELDPDLSEAYASLGFAVWAFDWDFPEAERLFQKSIRLNQNNAKAHEWYAYLLNSTARHDEAIEEMNRAERLDPNSPPVVSMFGFCLYNARRYREALDKTHRALELDPDYYLALQGLGWVYPPFGRFEEAIAGCRRAVLISNQLIFNKFSLALALIAAGQTVEAREIVREIEKDRSETFAPAYYPALIYAYLGDDDAAFKWLDKAIEERGYWTLWMQVEPRFDRLREDRRFIERLEKIKPLTSSKATGNLFSVETGELQTSAAALQSGRFRNRTAFAAGAAVLVCLVLLVIAANFKVVIFKKQDSPVEQPLRLAANGKTEKPRTSDPVADDLYLAGKQQMAIRSEDSINKALKFFEEAAGRDPNFALAFSGLADTHILLAYHKENLGFFQKAEEYALKALALDPDLAEARISLGMAKFRNTNDFAAAEKHFLRAIELDPDLATAHHWYSIILDESGKPEESLREIEIAARIDPRSAVIQHTFGEYLLKARRYDESIARFDKTIEIDKSFVQAYHWKSLIQQFQGDYAAALDTYRKARIYGGGGDNEPLWLLMQAQADAAAGRQAESRATLDRYFKGEVHRLHPEQYAAEVALVFNLLGDPDKAFEWLGKVKVKHASQPENLVADPRFANLHPDKRFEALKQSWFSAKFEPKEKKKS